MAYSACWLGYYPICSVPKKIAISSDFSGKIAKRACEELQLAFHVLYSCNVECTENGGDLQFIKNMDLPAEGYRISASCGKTHIEAADENGILYAVFSLIRQLRLRSCSFQELTWAEEAAPSNPMRMFDHWDNPDGTIERGYSGRSFFFSENKIILSERIQAYARLAASVGINGVVINNVNAGGTATRLITGEYFRDLRVIHDVFASYGIRLFLSVNFAAPIELGGLTSADPCDASVQVWWKNKADEIWQALPGFGGFLVKADSEGRPGPFTYGRTHADGANMLADALAPHGGKIIWRCFVYNCRQDWRDTKTDRPKAAYDNFLPLDGQFRDNVILQIKNGPVDFQVREPVAPLFGALRKTNMMVEFQCAQEYTGQQRHVCYLIPWFKQVLEQEMYVPGVPSQVADLVSGRSYGNTACGMAAVANTGNDFNWTGHDLAAANWYGFGRLAYNTSLTAEELASEWIRLTFGGNPQVEAVLSEILLTSWPAYEKYTAPLGIGWMVNPSNHYGPNVDGYEYDRWGTYHRADLHGLGVERGSIGTGFCAQYNEPLSSLYEKIESCPDELALFFHHLPYTHVLKSGKTVIQHIYDSHFEGAEEATGFLESFETLKELLPADAYERMHARFAHQKEHSCEWRDVINSYFYRKTGIPDEQGRTIY